MYYEDTDAGGVVFYANYLKYLERARTEWLRSMGFEQQRMIEEQDALFAVVSIEGNYRKPARLDDELAVTVEVEASGRSSLLFRQRVVRKQDDMLLFDGTVKVACLTASTFRPQAILANVREKFSA